LKLARLPSGTGRRPLSTRRITGAGGRTRVLILTTFDLDEYAFAGLRAGASGFLVKDALPTELLSGIRAVASGDAVVTPALTRRLIEKYAGQRARNRTGSRGRTRTYNLSVNSRTLCQLSYAGSLATAGGGPLGPPR
jgi:DNA-binding NarL/FixJ family response regulator